MGVVFKNWCGVNLCACACMGQSKFVEDINVSSLYALLIVSSKMVTIMVTKRS